MAARARTEEAAEAHHAIASCYLGKLFGEQCHRSDVNERDGGLPVNHATIHGCYPRFFDLRSVAESEELNGLLQKLS